MRVVGHFSSNKERGIFGLTGLFRRVLGFLCKKGDFPSLHPPLFFRELQYIIIILDRGNRFDDYKNERLGVNFLNLRSGVPFFLPRKKRMPDRRLEFCLIAKRNFSFLKVPKSSCSADICRLILSPMDNHPSSAVTIYTSCLFSLGLNKT